MNCRICDCPDASRTVVTREMMFGTRDEFTYFECARCGCVQIREVPDLTKYYPSDYYSFQNDGGLKRWLKSHWAAYSFDGSSPLIGRMMTFGLGKQPGVESVRRAGVSRDTSILDVGCGSGDLLQLLRAVGFKKLAGADPFLERDVLHPNGIPIWKKELEQVEGQYGLIMLHHAFEHMLDPAQFVVQAAQRLNDGGQLLIRVPVAGTMAWRTYGANWAQLDPPRHIFVPTVRSMELLAGRCGLRLREVVFDSTEFQFWASEQYGRDVPMRSPDSMLSLKKRALAVGTMRRQRRQAEELNARNDGDQACFYFQKPG